MKKVFHVRKTALLLAGLVVLGGALSLASASPIDFTTKYFEPVPTTPGHGKGPVRTPQVWQDDYELTFQGAHAAYTLDLLQDGIIVYSVEVSEEATSIILPSWLEGSYEIQLYTDSNYYFYGILTF